MNIKIAKSMAISLTVSIASFLAVCPSHAKYRNSEQLEWGVQGFGNVGQWDRWNSASQQEFKVGPALFGKIKTGTKEAIKWNAALLVGTTNATPNTTLRIQTEYEF